MIVKERETVFRLDGIKLQESLLSVNNKYCIYGRKNTFDCFLREFNSLKFVVVGFNSWSKGH